jgi:hypothetical protein
VFEQCDSYEALQRVCRRRAQELPITRCDLDAAAGVPAGLSGKALAENFVKRVRRAMAL